MADKVIVSSLIHLFSVIDGEVEKAGYTEAKAKAINKALKRFAQIAYNLGSAGQAEIELSDFETPTEKD